MGGAADRLSMQVAAVMQPSHRNIQVPSGPISPARRRHFLRPRNLQVTESWS